MPLDGDDESNCVYLRVSSDIWRADEVITVRGDSMEPTFHDGDDVLVEHTERLNPGEVGIFIISGEGFVKEYRPDGLHSHNPKYRTIHPSGDDEVRCAGRVLGVIPESWLATSRERAVLDKITTAGASAKTKAGSIWARTEFQSGGRNRNGRGKEAAQSIRFGQSGL